MDDLKRKLGYSEGWISIVVNTTLFIFKYLVGTATGSVAMVADAWHTMSDSLTSMVVILGFWIASKPGDEEHPFGHGRAEIIASVIIGTLLGVVGAGFIRESWLQLQRHKAVVFGTWSIVVFGISVVLKEALARYSFWAGRKVHAQSLVADGWHHRSDALASLLIIAGALLSKYLWWIDGVFGIGVSLLILFAAYGIIREAVNTLMGEKLDEETAGKVRAIVSGTLHQATDIHHIHVHRYGDHREMTMHLRLPGSMPLRDVHELATALERKLKDELNIETTIHMEPER